MRREAKDESVGYFKKKKEEEEEDFCTAEQSVIPNESQSKEFKDTAKNEVYLRF